MRKAIFASLAALTLVAGLEAAPAFASNLPGADQRGACLSAGLGLAAGLAYDADLTGTTRWGITVGDQNVQLLSPHVGLRVLQKLPLAGPIHVGVLGTLSGNANQDKSDGSWRYFGPSAGLGLAFAWSVTPSVAFRVNLANLLSVGPNFAGFSSLAAVFGWESGVEIGYRFTPQLEGTLGSTGLGQFLGVKYYL